MALVVLSYPALSKTDFAWIQSIRSKHDSLHYGVVDPHFTFVFPEQREEAKSLSEHVRERSRGFGPIPFALRCATIVKDAFNEYTHTFLIPDEGHGAMVRLHDALYRGRLADRLRLDLPYIPHIGIGSSTNPTACKDLADELNSRALAVEGTIRELEIATFDGRRVKTLERIAL